MAARSPWRMTTAALSLSGCSLIGGSTLEPATLAEGGAPPQASEGQSGCVVGPVLEHLGLDPFYQKQCDAQGTPILSSAQVEDRALGQAYYLITNMLAPIPEVRRELIRQRAYFSIVGSEEQLTTLTECSHMDNEYWDQRARGLGGSPRGAMTSSPEENLLCCRRGRYDGESSVVHEFAHTLHLIGLGTDYARFTAGLTRLYEAALGRGLWADTYAASDVKEYWAEGVQTYFNTNLETNPADDIHNQVNTRSELQEYGPGLYAFVDSFFHGFEWTPTCPAGAPQ